MSNNIYYVYIYYHPITMIPFYVGYGKNDRVYSHFNEARSNPAPKQNERKLNTIRKLLREGKEPIIKIIQSDMSKNEAVELEIKLIAEYGRLDKKTGTLTNKTMGGDGNRDWSDEQRKIMSDQRIGFVAAMDPVTGEKFKVKDTDHRWLNGKLVGHNSGQKGNTNKDGKLTKYIIALDPVTSESFRVKPDDERWLSGKLVGIQKGRPAHPNTVAAAQARKGIPKSAEHNKKNSDAIKQLKWYCNFETGQVRRLKEENVPVGFIRVNGPHKRIPI